MPTAVEEILRIEKAMVREFNAGQIQSLLEHFHARVVGFSSTRGERIKGRQAMRKTFEYYLHATHRIKYQIRTLEVQVWGDVGVAAFLWTVELGTGRPRNVIHGRGTHVLAREAGQWKIVHEHFSRVH